MLKPCFVCFKDSKKPPHMNVLKVEAKFLLSSLLSSNIENFWNGTLFYLFHSLFHSHCFTDFILQFYYTILFIVQTKIVKTSSYTHTTQLFFSLLSSLLNEKSVVKWKSERFRESDTNLEIKVTTLGALFSAIRRHSFRQRLKIAIISIYAKQYFCAQYQSSQFFIITFVLLIGWTETMNQTQNFGLTNQV